LKDKSQGLIERKGKIACKVWVMCFIHRRFAERVDKKLGTPGFEIFLQSEYGLSDGCNISGRRDRVDPDTPKGWVIWVNRLFGWKFIARCVQSIIDWRTLVTTEVNGDNTNVYRIGSPLSKNVPYGLAAEFVPNPSIGR
jgi:hypothetical protein